MTVTIEQLPNGLTVIVEEMSHVRSAAYDLLIPGGILSEPTEHVGASLILPELTARGAGPFDSRHLNDAFDEIGARRGEGTSSDKFAYSGSIVADKLPRALELVGEMVLRPRLPEGEIDSIRSVLLQDIASVTDSPSRWAMVELSKRFYPAPYNRPGIGTKEGVERATVTDCRMLWERSYRPERAILSVAGNVRSAEIKDLVERVFGDWSGKGVPPTPFPGFGAPQKHHVSTEHAQLQIALIYPSVPFGHRLYYAAKVALGVLSGGMFGRLFMEVREKRGLCYSVYARHAAGLDYGSVLAYAGTTPERAHDTLRVMLETVDGVAGTVTADELSRSKANIKAALVMGEESSGSRASSNAADWWLQKRIRTLEEIQRGIEAVTSADIDQFMQEFPASEHTLLTLGARALTETVS
jgi:predicted Zn-dependent peptidase